MRKTDKKMHSAMLVKKTNLEWAREPVPSPLVRCRQRPGARICRRGSRVGERYQGDRPAAESCPRLRPRCWRHCSPTEPASAPAPKPPCRRPASGSWAGSLWSRGSVWAGCSVVCPDRSPGCSCDVIGRKWTSCGFPDEPGDRHPGVRTRDCCRRCCDGFGRRSRCCCRYWCCCGSSPSE